MLDSMWMFKGLAIRELTSPDSTVCTVEAPEEFLISPEAFKTQTTVVEGGNSSSTIFRGGI